STSCTRLGWVTIASRSSFRRAAATTRNRGQRGSRTRSYSCSRDPCRQEGQEGLSCSDWSATLARMKCATIAGLLALTTSSVAAQQVVRYDPSEKDLKYVFATAPPV